MEDRKNCCEPPGAEELIPLSEKAQQHLIAPMNMRRMRAAQGHAIIEGSCGDTMEIWIRMAAGGEVIEEATFETNGCASSRACGSSATTLAKGLTLDEVFEMTPEEVLAQVDNVPEDHCATLAVNTLLKAVGQYMTKHGKA